ncbi:MAG: BatD family protein [bacterium]
MLALLAGTARAAAPQVHVEVEPNPVATNERLRVSIVVEGESVSDAEIASFPVIAGLRRLGGASTSESTSFVLGGGGGARRTSTRTITYSFLPEQAGDVTIPALEVTVGGKPMRTEPQVVHVTAGSANPRGSGTRQRGTDPFDSFFQDPFGSGRARTGTVEIPQMTIRRTLSRNAAFLGEPIILTVELWVGTGDGHIEQAGPVNGTDRTGFWVENLKVDTRATGRTQERDGQVFTVFTLSQQLLYATDAGRLTLPAETWRVVYRPSVLSLLAPAQEIFSKSDETVLTFAPLPEAGRPPAFSGLVGSFRVRSELDRQRSQVGDAVTWKVTLEGKGNLRTAGELPLPKPEGFEVFSSKSNDDVHVTEGGLAGTRVSEQVLIPRSAGSLQVPPLRIAFFDPAASEYRWAEAPGHALEVTAAAGAAPAVIAPAASSPTARAIQQANDIRYIRPATRALKVERTWTGSGLFWLVALAAPLANAALWGRRRQLVRQGRDPIGLRRRQAFARLERGLARLDGSGAEALAQVASLLSAFLNDRFGIPRVDLTAARLRERGAEWGLPAAATEELVRLITELDAARFGGGAGDLGAVRERVLAVARATLGSGS